MNLKKLAVIGTGVVVGSMVVPFAMNALNLQSSEGFGLDDVAAALIIAAVIIAVDRMI